MKKLLILFSVLCTSLLVNGQTATVSGTIQDPTTQVFANGTITISFVPTAGANGPFTVSGNPIQLAGSNYVGPITLNLDGTGSFSTTMSRNDFIFPSQSQWQFIVCPNATAACTTVNLTIASANANVSNLINAVVPNIAVVAGSNVPRAYSNSEIIVTPNPGQNYWNVTNATLNFWNGSSWLTALLSGSSPTFTNLTVTAAATVGTTLGVTGATTLSGGGTLTGTFAGNPIFSGNPSFTGIIKVKNFEQIRYVDDSNTAGWSGSDVCAQEHSAEADLPSGSCGIIDMTSLSSSTFYSCSGTWAWGSTCPNVIIKGPNQTIVITPTANNPVITQQGTASFWGFNSSNNYQPGGGSRLQSGGAGTGDMLQWKGSNATLKDVSFNTNNARLGLHLLATNGNGNITKNKFDNVQIVCDGSAGSTGFHLTGADANDTVFSNHFTSVSTQQCDQDVKTDTSNNQGPTTNFFDSFEFASTVATASSICTNLGGTNTATIYFTDGHCSTPNGTNFKIASGVSAASFVNIRSENGGSANTDMNDAGSGTSFIGGSFTNCTTSTFASSAIILPGFSNTPCAFNQVPNVKSVNFATARMLSSGTAPTSCAVTGAGATGSCAVTGGSTDSIGELIITAAGAGPAANGTLTLTPSASLGPTHYFCLFNPSSVGNAWNAIGTSIQQTNNVTSSAVANWNNNGTALVASNTYWVSYQCSGR